MTALTGTRVLIRTDASLQIGSGHVRRCLTLAEALRSCAASVRFVIRAHAGHMADTIRARGFEVSLLPSMQQRGERSRTTAHDEWLGADWRSDAAQTVAALNGKPVDWVIVDHYALESGWESALRPHARRLLAIDDLADRRHDSDILLDQNLGREAADYATLVTPACRLLAGPQFALLRPQFATRREASLQRRRYAKLRHLLITMGGVDRTNVTGRVLEVLPLCELPADLRITIVMGAQAPALAVVRELAAKLLWPARVLAEIDDMAALMADCDLAIGAAGGTAWERCCVGLPTLLVIQADNQATGARALHASGAAWLLGDASSLRASLPAALGRCADAATLYGMSAAAARVTDGAGVARVLAELAAAPVVTHD